MKRLFLIFILCFQSIYAEKSKQTICLSMIVKNEAHVIERCLNSVKPIIDSWVIMDTGSTDGTQEVIQKCLEGIPGELHNRPWIDFAHNRNESLEIALQKADYVLIMDADDYLEFDDDFMLPELDQDAYLFNIHLGSIQHKRTQLIKASLPWVWKGVLHEYLDIGVASSLSLLQGVTYREQKEGARSLDPDKFLKDIAILEAALKQEPDNQRYLFYLAQSYRDAGMFEKALNTYRKSSEKNTWEEEVFIAKYQIAFLSELLEYPFEEVTKNYTDAFLYRPSRAEPLMRLAHYLRSRNHHSLAYLIADRGLEIPLPEDFLYTEMWVYEWGLKFEKALCSSMLNHHEESLQLHIELLEDNQLPEELRKLADQNIASALIGLKKRLSKKHLDK